MTNQDNQQMTLSERLDRIEAVIDRIMNDDFMAGSQPASIWWTYVRDRSGGGDDSGDLAPKPVTGLTPLPPDWTGTHAIDRNIYRRHAVNDACSGLDFGAGCTCTPKDPNDGS